MRPISLIRRVCRNSKRRSRKQKNNHQCRRRISCGGAFLHFGGDRIYIYPDNLNAKATLWLWQLRDLAVIGIGLLIAVLALTQLGLFLPMVLVAAYAFLSIHLDRLSVLDFLSFVVSFYITEQQIFEWEDPT